MTIVKKVNKFTVKHIVPFICILLVFFMMACPLFEIKSEALAGVVIAGAILVVICIAITASGIVKFGTDNGPALGQLAQQWYLQHNDTADTSLNADLQAAYGSPMDQPVIELPDGTASMTVDGSLFHRLVVSIKQFFGIGQNTNYKQDWITIGDWQFLPYPAPSFTSAGNSAIPVAYTIPELSDFSAGWSNKHFDVTWTCNKTIEGRGIPRAIKLHIVQKPDEGAYVTWDGEIDISGYFDWYFGDGFKLSGMAYLAPNTVVQIVKEYRGGGLAGEDRLMITKRNGFDLCIQNGYNGPFVFYWENGARVVLSPEGKYSSIEAYVFDTVYSNIATQLPYVYDPGKDATKDLPTYDVPTDVTVPGLQALVDAQGKLITDQQAIINAIEALNIPHVITESPSIPIAADVTIPAEIAGFRFPAIALSRFPFCIAWDVVSMFKLLLVKPIKPDLSVGFNLGKLVNKNNPANLPKYNVLFKIDETWLDTYIPIGKYIVYGLFLVGLALGTRKLIWGS